jgi:hypothetical protein
MRERSATLVSNLTNVQDRHPNFACNVVKEGIKYFRFDPDLDTKPNSDDHGKIGKLDGETEMHLGMKKSIVTDEMCEVRLRLIAYAKRLVDALYESQGTR